jgi:hypothetical protein
MFAVPASSLLFATRRDPFAVSSTTLGDLCHPEFPLPASGRSLRAESGEQKGQNRESCQASQNEHLQKSSHNSREINTYIKVAGGPPPRTSSSLRTSFLGMSFAASTKARRRTMRLGGIGGAAIIPLHSYSCAMHTRNSRGIKLLQKSGVGAAGPRL